MIDCWLKVLVLVILSISHRERRLYSFSFLLSSSFSFVDALGLSNGRAEEDKQMFARR